MKPVFVPIGLRTSRMSRPQGPRRECLRGSRQPSRPVEPNPEQATVVLDIANGHAGGDLGLFQPHHLLRPLGLSSSALKSARVVLAVIGVGSALAQRWQRSRGWYCAQAVFARAGPTWIERAVLS
jgi:hypothetical protein